MMHNRRLGVLALAAALLAAGPARAVDRQAVDRAVGHGAKYLKGQQLGNGTWAYDQIGLTALCGLTLLECDVPAEDAHIQRAAAAVRAAAVDIDQTYSVSLAILFLDRLGEPVDVALIESLTVRLLGGQTSRGGWAYVCPRTSAEEQRRLMTLVKHRLQRGPDKEGPRPEPGRRTEKDLPREIRGQLEQVRRQQAGGGRPGGVALNNLPDNSNTQFAILGLWVARRHGLPVDAALDAADQYFRRSRNPDGGWSYQIAGFMPGVNVPPGAPRPGPMGSSPAMTCAGLLGVGLAYGAWNEAALRTDKDKDKGPEKRGAPEGREQDPSKDRVVVDAFNLLGHWVDDMAAGQRGGRVPRVNMANGKFYYFLWSLERVAVAYGIDKVGKTDWYEWGAEILLANQGADGSWSNGEFRGPPDTCFALLVLRRANLAQDLSRALKSQMKEGLQAALRQGGLGGAELIKGRKPFFDGTAGENKEKPGDDADAQAERLGKQLAAAEAGKQERLINELRDGKGAAFTQALAVAIPRLDGEAKKKAREALAERLSRMTAETLDVKLADDDAEVRRAAALAVAMREDKTRVPKLIDLLRDEEVSVSRAAHAALHSLSGEDFGPAKDATPEERGKAVLAWKEWWAKQQEKK